MLSLFLCRSSPQAGARAVGRNIIETVSRTQLVALPKHSGNTHSVGPVPE